MIILNKSLTTSLGFIDLGDTLNNSPALQSDTFDVKTQSFQVTSTQKTKHVYQLYARSAFECSKTRGQQSPRKSSGPSGGFFGWWGQVLNCCWKLPCCTSNQRSPVEVPAVSVKKSLTALGNPASAEPDFANAERDLRRILSDLGYSLPIPIHSIEHATGETEKTVTYHLRPQDWVKFLMEAHPELLGGHTGNCYDNFKTFWEMFRTQHSTHAVFEKHNDHLHRVIPLLLHGDEGRAVKRTNYFVTSVESPLGSCGDPNLHCSCAEKLQGRSRLPSYGSDAGHVSSETLRQARTMVTNFKGHSYLSRYLLFGVGGWVYKKFPHIISKLLDEVALNLKSLFETGVTLSNGTVVFAALVSIKGDMDWHRKSVKLTRSYANCGTVNSNEICHHCLAGGSSYDFEDYAENPAWSQSLYVSRPWEEEPYFTMIPHDREAPEKMLQGDLMHVFKLGIGRDIVGGILIILLRKGYFDMAGESKDIRARFSRAYNHFALWCKAMKKSAGIRSFSKGLFNMKSLMSAPWANTKASDTMMLLDWLSFFLRTNKTKIAGFEVLLGQMLQLSESALALRMVHHHPLWLERECARFLYINMMTLLRAYALLGKKAIDLKIRAFIQKPKAHALHHIAYQLKTQLLSGASLVASPQMNACDINEDFLGRISRLSRRVGFRLVDLHVCERYFLKISTLIKRKHLRKVRPRMPLRKRRR